MSLHRAIRLLPWSLTIVLLAGGCVSSGGVRDDEVDGIASTPVVDTRGLLDLPRLLERIAHRRVIYVGETHDRYEHHLVQLEIIRRLHERGRPLTVAMEFFQQPYQEWLDRWVAGEIDEAAMLRGTEYFTRWRFDYRLYRPILRYTREQGIPLVALNVPREVTQAVSRKGFDGLDAAQRHWIPDSLDTSNLAYRERLQEVFSRHPPKARERAFQHFYEAQLLWDEGMAERLAQVLRERPNHTVVVLAGSGHVVRNEGIPARLRRRMSASDVVLVLGADALTNPEVADYILAPRPQELPPRGLLGIFMEEREGAVVVAGFSENSAAREAGLREGDRIRAMDGKAVRDTVDVRLALLDAPPGREVTVEVERAEGETRRRYTFTVQLRAETGPAHP